MKIVDIVVPVYLGTDATRRCIASILDATVTTRFELIVVNDASPEPELVREIRELGRLHKVTLLEQPLRQGFASAVNRAIALHRDRDVVILHADAEVANDWLDRLARHAQVPGVGAVAPFTNAYGVATSRLRARPIRCPPDIALRHWIDCSRAPTTSRPLRFPRSRGRACICAAIAWRR
jgi:glycosyltransferase involved in cell wall biosynthesis